MAITILNTTAELNSFPISQSIKLSSTELLEEAVFADNIILFRLQSENQLISLSEPYSYNLGYLKETFDRTEMNFKVETSDVGFTVSCTPKKLLNLDSTYCLYVSNRLGSKFLNITKSNSKSQSDITVNLKDNFTVKSQYILKIEDTSYISNNKNIVRVSLDGRLVTLDVRSQNKVILNNLEISLEDTIYVKGEEFLIDIDPSATIDEELQTYIYTVNSSSIKPIPKEETSTTISNLDILNFYNTINTNKPTVIEKAYPKYLNYNVFSIKLPEGYSVNKTANFKYSLTLAFNNYILESLKLYDSSLKYVCTIYIDEFENEVIFELTYSKDRTQTDTVIFNLDNLG